MYSVPMPAAGLAATVYQTPSGPTDGMVVAAVGGDRATYVYLGGIVIFGPDLTQAHMMAAPLECLRGIALGRPAVAVTLGWKRVLVRGANNRVYLRAFNPQTATWSSWSAAPGALISSGPAATSGRAIVGNELVTETFAAVRGLNNVVYLLHLRDNRWLPTERLGGTTFDTPAVYFDGTRVLVAVRGTNGGIYLKSGRPGRWSAWTRLSGTASGAPVMSGDPQTSQLELFVLGNNGWFYSSAYSAGRWSAFHRLAFGPYPAGTPIGAAGTAGRGDLTLFAELADRTEYAALLEGVLYRHSSASYLCLTCGPAGEL